jgi:hypothetical protein
MIAGELNVILMKMLKQTQIPDQVRNDMVQHDTHFLSSENILFVILSGA